MSPDNALTRETRRLRDTLTSQWSNVPEVKDLSDRVDTLTVTPPELQV